MAAGVGADAGSSGSLAGRVAVVTGASRGIGKGIALELGRAGATVYVTGRSSRAGGVTTERPLGDGAGGEGAGGAGGGNGGGRGATIDATVDATAEAIDGLPGPGKGVPVVCDAGDDAQVEDLVRRVQEEAGRLDCLVCSAFTTPPQLNGAAFRDDFWRQGSAMWDACNQVGLRGVYVRECARGWLLRWSSGTTTNHSVYSIYPPVCIDCWPAPLLLCFFACVLRPSRCHAKSIAEALPMLASPCNTNPRTDARMPCTPLTTTGLSVILIRSPRAPRPR